MKMIKLSYVFLKKKQKKLSDLRLLQILLPFIRFCILSLIYLLAVTIFYEKNIFSAVKQKIYDIVGGLFPLQCYFHGKKILYYSMILCYWVQNHGYSSIHTVIVFLVRRKMENPFFLNIG